MVTKKPVAGAGQDKLIRTSLVRRQRIDRACSFCQDVLRSPDTSRETKNFARRVLALLGISAR